MKIGKLMIGLMILAVAVLVFIGMMKFASILGFLMFYPYVVQQIAGYGLNTYLAQAIGLIVGAGLWFVVIKLFFAWREERRLLGFGILIGFYALHLLVMFFLPGDALVHPTTGEPDFCTVDKLTGRILTFEASVFDKYGQKAEPCTAEQIERYEIETQYGDDENPEVDIWTVSKGFISPATGQTFFYYCHDPSGRPKFFTLTGFCPWGGKLQPATAEVVKVELAKAQAERDLVEAEERKQRAAEERAENLKILAQQKQEREDWDEKQAALKARKAKVEFNQVSWGNVISCGFLCLHYGVDFYVREVNGIGAVYDKATLRAWIHERDESQSVYLKRAPEEFTWELSPPIHVAANQEFYKNPAQEVDLEQFSEAIKAQMSSTNTVWLELTIVGVDENGHRQEYTFK